MQQCSNCGFIPNQQTMNTPEDLDDPDGVSDPRIQLQELDFQIAQAQALIRALRRQRFPLKTRINRHHSPILRLPPELYSDIFTACLPDVPWNSLCGAETIPYSTIPLSIGMVCRAWRELAWSMPHLWSMISLSLDKSTPSRCDLMKEWISRSGQSRLSIHIACSFNQEDIQRSSILPMLGIIAGCSDRWFQIYFAIPPHCYQALESIRNRLPLLNFMSLRLNRSSGFMRFNGFDATPQLRHVEIANHESGSINLSLSQVTRLSLTRVTTEQCQNILAGCPNLSHCSFANVFPSGRSWSHILSPNMEYLDIQVKNHHGAGALSKLLGSLTIPGARELRINNGQNDLPFLEFISMLSRSSCSLKRLALINCPCSELELFRCLQVVPFLVHLEFSVSNLMNTVVYALDHSDPSNIGFPCLLPNLRSLTLRSYPVGLLGLVSMLSSRWRNDAICTVAGDYIHATQLQTVAVSHPKDVVPDASVLAQLRELVAEGMNITLRTGSGRHARAWV
jgi:hypothetical protein